MVKLRVGAKALNSFRERVRKITSRTGGRSLDQVAGELRAYLLGWKQYFGLADTPKIFHRLDEWVHRRLRMLQLRQWKRGTTTFRELRRRGVSEAVAAMAARFTGDWWHVEAHKALQVALPGEYFRRIGVPILA